LTGDLGKEHPSASLLQKLIEQHAQPSNPSAPVFFNNRGTRLTCFGVGLVLHKYVEKAVLRHPSLKHKRLHPHSIHSTATHFLPSGVDLSTIAHWLGHASVNTTNKYISVDLVAKRETLAKAKPLLKWQRHSGKWRRDQTSWLA
jgi:integrase/recombinase XerD